MPQPYSRLDLERSIITMSEQSDIRMEEGRHGCGMQPHQQGQCLLQRFCNSPTWRRRAPSPKTYPPISSIPKTSPERLALASLDSPSPSVSTVLYLAYGSNLSAETFLGVRGIRPISQINVSAPAFDLSFDLPGIPYYEPCFANTRPRRLPKPPKFPPPPYNPSPLSPELLFPSLPDRGPTWSKGLYGVVYEVTPEDYATIIRTEGGGRGYQDVLTACFELPPALHVPEKPPIPELPKPFLAHTLYAPSLPDLPGGDEPDEMLSDEAKKKGDGDDDDDDDDDDGGDGGDKDPRNQPWFRRLLLPVHRPDPDYAQASARYLKLLRDGAREHALPDDYQAYLGSLQPYTITSFWQQVGRILFSALALPLMLLMMGLTFVLADKDGRVPRWFGLATTALMNLLWGLYDAFFKPVFGDGERTEPKDKDGDADHDQGARRRRSTISGGAVVDKA
ncbi:hypothetical protein F5Y19DRAFT_357053 [Xylariaceae sp. FL1651]|nr:hypothetical protein F5Y19DRAFT_357053 [Xylariaceae sp. FL1651]